MLLVLLATKVQYKKYNKMHLSLYQFKHYSNQILEIKEVLQVVVGNNGS